jgi:antitoxin VapB
MALYIRDDEVNDLARELQTVLNAPSKTEAVRIALLKELERTRGRRPLAERVRDIQDAVRAMGPDDPNLDMKQFMDDLSGGM